jgi:hypothetical protein
MQYEVRHTLLSCPFPPFLLSARQRRRRKALITTMHLVLLSRSLRRARMGEEGLEDGEFGGEAFGGRSEGEREVCREGGLGDAEVGGENAGDHNGDDVLDVAFVLFAGGD